MWIRSQNKHVLINVDSVAVSTDTFEVYEIKSNTLLGEYKSLEDALTVINIIEKLLNLMGEESMRVYNMPTIDELEEFKKEREDE